MNNKMKNFTLIAVLLIFPSAALAQAVVYPGTYTISLGTYSDWNTQAAASEACDLYELQCELDSDEYRVVGDTTSSASTASELQTLTQSFGFECLDKAAVFADIGQHVYPDVGYYDGPLHQHFVAEANKCWNHYDKVYQDNKDSF